MFRHAQAAEMNSDFLQLIAAYNALEVSIQAHCLIPTPDMSKRKWLEEVDLRATLFENIVERANANSRRFTKGKQEARRGSPRYSPRLYQSINQYQQNSFQNQFRGQSQSRFQPPNQSFRNRGNSSGGYRDFRDGDGQGRSPVPQNSNANRPQNASQQPAQKNLPPPRQQLQITSRNGFVSRN
jgi:hypothetical protein